MRNYPIDIRKGDQKGSDYLKLNLYGKISNTGAHRLRSQLYPFPLLDAPERVFLEGRKRIKLDGGARRNEDIARVALVPRAIDRRSDPLHGRVRPLGHHPLQLLPAHGIFRSVVPSFSTATWRLASEEERAPFRQGNVVVQDRYQHE